MNVTEIKDLESRLKEAELLDNPDVLKLLERYKDKSSTKYGLVWEDHPEQVYEELKSGITNVTEYEDKKIMMDPEKPQNLLIEGDNLHGLMLMKEEGVKVDVIYIDPPYNTGNEFIYNDKIVDSEDGYRHSKWLSFMSKRLELAYDLLEEDGVIFVSIDDNEQANLKLLMDKIYGERNMLGLISTVNNLKGRSDDNFFATSNEFLLVYAKSSDKASIYGLDLSEDMVKEYNEVDDISRFKLIGLKKTGKNSLRTDRPNMYYPIYYDKKDKTFSLESSKSSIEILPYINGKEGRWRWGRDTFLQRKDSELVCKRQNSGYVVYTKMRDIVDGQKRTLRPKTTWIDPRYDSGSGTRLMTSMFGTGLFDNPKPIEYIKDILKVSSRNKKEAIILDFFAGSGTTAQAVMELNEEDGGNRQFILMTNNEVSTDTVFNLAKEDSDVVKLLEENKISLLPHKGTGSVAKNKQRKIDIETFFESGDGKDFFNSDIVQDEGICRKVTYERVRRVIEGDYVNKKDVDPLPNNLSYYKLDVEQDFDFKDHYKYKMEQSLLGFVTKEKVSPVQIDDTTYVFDRGNSQALVYDASLFVTQESVDKVYEMFDGYSFEVVSEHNNADIKLKNLRKGVK